MSDNNNNNRGGNYNNNNRNNSNSNNRSNNNRNNSNRNNNNRNNNNNNRSNNNNSRNNNNSNNNEVKGACEELGYSVFDCTSRKQIEQCNETLKAIAIHVGSKGDYGKSASNIKYVIENLKDPDLDPPSRISATDAKDNTKWFEYTEQYKRYLDRKEGLEAGKKKLYSLLWGQCTQLMKNELQAMDDFQTM